MASYYGKQDGAYNAPPDHQPGYAVPYDPHHSSGPVANMEQPQYLPPQEQQATARPFQPYTGPSYEALHQKEDGFTLQDVKYADDALKSRIRRLRLIARCAALLLSIAAFVPLVLTVHKFISTRDIYNEVNGKSRTAWAAHTRAWPTYMYFTIALISLCINIIIVASYARGVRSANRAGTLGTLFTVLTLLVEIGIWIVVLVIYKYEKEVTHDGKHQDLWGWSCSPAARAIQHAFEKEVPFNQYCNIQTAGWIAGLLELAVLALSTIIYTLAMRRSKSKKNVRRMTQELGR